jgi:type IV pilus assembly protein PilM
MDWQFLNGGSSRKKRNQILAVDLGARTTKAVVLERRGERLALTRFALTHAPIYETKLPPEMLTSHLRSVFEELGGPTKSVVLALGLDDTVVRQVELPPIPVDEMRLVLKNNSKAYLQQDLSDHVFDCHIFQPNSRPHPTATSAAPAELQKPAGVSKAKVLAGAAKKQMMNDYEQAIRNAGLIPESIVPGLIGPVNAFEMAMPQVFANDAIALVDIGFKHSTICVLDRGELVLTRVVNIGGDKLTAGLAEAMNISYPEAEGIKVGMAPKGTTEEDITAFQMQLTAFGSQVMPLGRELRASLDFFEHQQDRTVTQVFVSGGAARSEVFLDMLRSEMIAECKTWNPAEFLELTLPGQQADELNQVRSQLAVAIGAALAAL